MKVDRIKERLRNIRRTFKQNWTLFKESRIGIFGLMVILFFLVIALLAPILDINDPILFRAPEEDVIGIDRYWVTDNKEAYGALEGNTSIGFRAEGLSFNPLVDRVYVASSNRLFAYRPNQGHYSWTSPLSTNGLITTDVLVVNYGENQGSNFEDYWIYVGTTNGYVYAVNDSTSGTSFVSVQQMKLDSEISSIVVYNDETNPRKGTVDRVFIGTTSGKLHAFSALNHTEEWNISLDGEVMMTANPLRGTGGYPSYSPTLTQDGGILLAGTGNGSLYAISTSNSTILWKYELEETTWSSSPYIGVKEVEGEVAYFGTDEGWFYALYANNGTEIIQWKGLTTEMRGLHIQENRGLRGIPVLNLQNQPDGGTLTTPAVYWGGVNGTTIIFTGSSSGSFYKISRNQVGEPGEDTFRPPGSTINEFRTEGAQNIEHSFDVQPIFYPIFGLPKYVFAVENHDNGTAQMDDDKGAVYAMSLNLTLSWKISETGGEKFSTIDSMPLAWSSGQITDSVWFVTSDSVAFSYAASGRYLAPLPPTWVEPLESGNIYHLGVDTLGHDVFSQVVFGTRTALLVGFLAAFFSIMIGIIIGLVSGYFGGKTDSVLMRFTDVILVLPFLPLVIVLAAVLGPSIWNIIVVIAILGWGGVARVIRSEVLSLKERPFIESAKVTGASSVRIMFKHIAPNVLPLAFLYMTFAVSGAILTEAALSFIGLGDFTQPSWGIMLFYIQQTDALQYWWLLWPPGLCITFLSLGFYLVGRAFEQIVNPRLRRRR
jgi:ABC-type dipeptide/oligopeptide/nickel transport system permease subunit